MTSTDYEQLRLAMGDANRAVWRLQHIARELRSEKPLTDLAGAHSQRSEVARTMAATLEDWSQDLYIDLTRRCREGPIPIHKPEAEHRCPICFVRSGNLNPYCETCSALPLAQKPADDDILDPFEGAYMADARTEWLAGLREGDEVMRVHDSGNYAPQRFTVYSIDDNLIRIKRLTAVRRYRRSDGREEGGFAWHIAPVPDDALHLGEGQG